jgi:hypothetical protein
VYNNHVFIDYRDARLGADSSINWDEGTGYEMRDMASSITFAANGPQAGLGSWPAHYSTTLGNFTQSLPDFSNPCSRIWDRYFAANASVQSWFTGQHSVSLGQFMTDCNSTVVSWRKGVKQIR